MTPRRLAHRLLASVRRRRLDADLDGEILAHLELAERDGVARGLSPEEARRAALLEFGGVEQIKEDHREGRSLSWLEHALRDFRHGLSGLGRNPGFAIAAVGILALGIGATTAVFSVVDAALLKPLPFEEPERMVTVIEAEGQRFWGVSALNFVDWHRMASSFEALSAESQVTASVIVGGEPERWTGYLATADYFKAYGVGAALGRTFARGEDRPEAPRVIVLSHAAWQDRFGGAPDILDRELVVDGEAHRIVGVLPPASFDREQALFWKPLVFAPERLTRETMWLRAVGRLRPGISLERARAEMLQVSADLERVNPPWKKGWRAAVSRFGENLVGQRLRQSIYVAFGAVVMVLLIASANIGTLLLVRGTTRRKEMAVRAALGASRGRLVGQLLSESLALSLAGGAAGVGLAHLVVQAARPLLWRTLPPTADVSVDPRVLAFAACLVLGVSLLVGLLPALRTSAGHLAAHLGDAARGTSRSNSLLRRTIVVSEVAVSLVLVCGALLMVRSLLNLQSAHPGFRIDNVITTSLELPAPAHPRGESVTAFFRTLVERLRAMPGVESASVTSDLPLEGVQAGSVVLAPGLVEGRVVVGLKWVDPHYFSTLDVGVVSGRGVAEGDVPGAPRVVVVNQELAARLGTPDPVGRVVAIALSDYGSRRADLAELQIVGVIRSECIGQLHETARPVAYLPAAQWPVRDMRLVIRTSGDAAAVIPAMRKTIRSLDPGLPLADVSTMRQVKERSFADTTESAWAIGLFALVAALLAASGLYGVLAQAVTQQRREIGIRMALGAAPRAMVSRILRGAMALVGAGLAAGLLGALVLTGVMRGLLFQVSALDPLAFVLACATMALVAAVAVLVPASRAARIDPVLTLREEG